MRHALRSYWDGRDCLYPPFREALAIEQANQGQLQSALAEYRPDVVSFWHMGAMSLGLITTTLRLGYPVMFVDGACPASTSLVLACHLPSFLHLLLPQSAPGDGICSGPVG